MSKKDQKEKLEETEPGTIGVGIEQGGGDQLKEVSNPITIQSLEAAKKFVLDNYKSLSGDKITYVIEDRNVFTKENENLARFHARQHNLKLFEVIWD